MDAISLAIAVTVLSVASVLVYLFKSEFDVRQNIFTASPGQQKQQHNRTNKQPTKSPANKSKGKNGLCLTASKCATQVAGDCSEREEFNSSILSSISNLVYGKPKNDLLTSLESRVCDLQQTLSNETADHEKTQAQLRVTTSELYKQQSIQKQLAQEKAQLISKLEQVNCDLSKQQLLQKQLEDENSRMLEQLEHARCNLSQQQRIQREIQNENLQSIERVEQDKAKLQAMLLELQLVCSQQEEMLEKSREERHMNEISMKKTLLEMEEELKELQSKLSANLISHEILESLNKKTVDKATSTFRRNKPSSRVSSPISNGRSSKAATYYDSEGKKEMEIKMLEALALFCLRCLD